MSFLIRKLIRPHRELNPEAIGYQAVPLTTIPIFLCYICRILKIYMLFKQNHIDNEMHKYSINEYISKLIE